MIIAGSKRSFCLLLPAFYFVKTSKTCCGNVRSRFFRGAPRGVKPVSACFCDFCDLLVFIVEIAAASAVFTRAGYLNRAESAILSVVVVFAIANVAFDAFVFILHIKDLLSSPFLLWTQKEVFIPQKANLYRVYFISRNLYRVYFIPRR